MEGVENGRGHYELTAPALKGKGVIAQIRRCLSVGRDLGRGRMPRHVDNQSRLTRRSNRLLTSATLQPAAQLTRSAL